MNIPVTYDDLNKRIIGKYDNKSFIMDTGSANLLLPPNGDVECDPAHNEDIVLLFGSGNDKISVEACQSVGHHGIVLQGRLPGTESDIGLWGLATGLPHPTQECKKARNKLDYGGKYTTVPSDGCVTFTGKEVHIEKACDIESIQNQSNTLYEWDMNNANVYNKCTRYAVVNNHVFLDSANPENNKDTSSEPSDTAYEFKGTTLGYPFFKEAKDYGYTVTLDYGQNKLYIYSDEELKKGR